MARTVAQLALAPDVNRCFTVLQGSHFIASRFTPVKLRRWAPMSMERLASGLVFAASYAVGIVLVAELNASYIIRDAVVGPIVVASVYVGLFAPAAVAAFGAVVFADVQQARRMRLAVIFALVIIIGVEGLFALAQSAALADFARRADLALLAVMNVVFISSFIAVGARLRRNPASGAA